MTEPFGIYQHYKGSFYRVLCCGHLSEDRTQKMVVYISLSPGGSYGVGAIWIRPLAMWDELVEYAGRTVKRFTQVVDAGS